MCEEMLKLRKWLDEQKIEWWDDSECIDTLYQMHRTKFMVDGNLFSVINGVGSYGGCVYVGAKNLGLLECWDEKGAPVGYLTAEDVIKMVKEVRSC